MYLNISVLGIKETKVVDFSDDVDSGFATVNITTDNDSEVTLHFKDLEAIQDWATQVSLQVELLREKK